MNRVLSTHVICNHRLTTAWLNRVEGAGISAVEIFCAPQHLDYRDKSQIGELGPLVPRLSAEAALPACPDVYG